MLYILLCLNIDLTHMCISLCSEAFPEHHFLSRPYMHVLPRTHMHTHTCTRTHAHKTHTRAHIPILIPIYTYVFTSRVCHPYAYIYVSQTRVPLPLPADAYLYPDHLGRPAQPRRFCPREFPRQLRSRASERRR
jgi:hypothetical protein